MYGKLQIFSSQHCLSVSFKSKANFAHRINFNFTISYDTGPCFFYVVLVYSSWLYKMNNLFLSVLFFRWIKIKDRNVYEFFFIFFIFQNQFWCASTLYSCFTHYKCMSIQFLFKSIYNDVYIKHLTNAFVRNCHRFIVFMDFEF